MSAAPAAALSVAAATALVDAVGRIALLASDRLDAAILDGAEWRVRSARSMWRVAEDAYAEAKVRFEEAHAAEAEREREQDEFDAACAAYAAELDAYDARLAAEQARFGVDVLDYNGGLFPLPC